MPLSPLEPLDGGVDRLAVSARTFKEPVLAPASSPAPVLPGVSSSGASSRFPIRVTSSSECDCGKEH